jgi:hypothetical protein
VKWAQAQRAKGYVNMWDYILRHPLYAWDFAQQQAVLNAFYGEHSLIAAGLPTDEASIAAAADALASDKARCNQYRPSRPTEYRDPTTYKPDGSQCRTDKTVSQPMVSSGR